VNVHVVGIIGRVGLPINHRNTRLLI